MLHFMTMRARRAFRGALMISALIGAITVTVGATAPGDGPDAPAQPSGRGGRGGRSADAQGAPTTTPAGRGGRGNDAGPIAATGSIDKASITQHELKIGNEILKYQATAAYMQMKDEAGKLKADMFFVAYEKTPAVPARERPIAFVFNGGPGAAAIWLHIGTAGPQRVLVADTGEALPPPYKLVDNTGTWLREADLVFIDPVGTGYSRAAAGENEAQFYGVQEDVRAVSDFIRLYLTKYKRWSSPKFLMGESYGTTRAAALSAYLMDRLGIALNGIVFISTVLDFQTLSPGPGNDTPYALFLPSYTAIAWHHKKLAPDLQEDMQKAVKESRDFALGEYLSDLAKATSLTGDERSAFMKKVARLTGLPEAFVAKADGRISPGVFEGSLLADERKIIGRFDGRITADHANALSPTPEFDPSHIQYLTTYTGSFNAYVREQLGFESDLPYEALSGRTRPWNFGTQGQGFLDVSDDLKRAMIENPYMKVMFCSGYQDLATPFTATDFTLSHMQLTEALRANITRKMYTGGHMIYHVKDSREQMNTDIRTFIKQSSAVEKS